MRKAFRHTGVLMMLGVVALGLVGAAYTLWFEQLQINATVSTGTLNADMSYHPWTTTGPSDEGSFTGSGVSGKPVVAIVQPGESGLDWGVAGLLGLHGITDPAGWARFTYANFLVNGSQKPLPTCQGAVATDNTGLHANDEADHNVLNLTLSGLYPFAGCEFRIDIHNSGSVPFHVAVTKVSGDECDADGTSNCVAITDFPWSRGFDPASGAACAAFFNADWHTVPGQINVPGINNTTTPLQLHGGDDFACNFMMVLDENPGAENHVYHFHATYAAYQWNENPNLSILPATNP